MYLKIQDICDITLYQLADISMTAYQSVLLYIP